MRQKRIQPNPGTPWYEETTVRTQTAMDDDVSPAQAAMDWHTAARQRDEAYLAQGPADDTETSDGPWSGGVPGEPPDTAPLTLTAARDALRHHLEHLGDQQPWDNRAMFDTLLAALEQATVAPPQDDDPMPEFVIKAQDELARRTIQAYLDLCHELGLRAQAEQVRLAYNEIAHWQLRHPDRMKLPDHRHVPATARQ